MPPTSLPVPVLTVVSRIIGVVILIFSFYFSSCFMLVNSFVRLTYFILLPLFCPMATPHYNL
jgi:hypothetical protein